MPLPLIGPVLKRNRIARWCDAVHIAVQAGMDLPAGIGLAGDAVHSPALRQDGKKIIDALAAGRPLGDVDNLRVLMPTVTVAMEVGIERSDLPATLDSLATMYQQQAEVRLGVLNAALLPFLLIVIGVTMGMVILALFAPMVALLGGLSM